VLSGTRAEQAESDRILDHSSAWQFISDDLSMLVQHLNAHVLNNLVATLLCRHHAAEWPSLPPTTLPTPEALTKELAAFQKATAYFNNNGIELEQEETQPDPELNATWNKLVLLISNDTKGYKLTTVEALTHSKGTGRLVYGKHTAMAAASRNIVQNFLEAT